MERMSSKRFVLLAVAGVATLAIAAALWTVISSSESASEGTPSSLHDALARLPSPLEGGDSAHGSSESSRLPPSPPRVVAADTREPLQDARVLWAAMEEAAGENSSTSGPPIELEVDVHGRVDLASVPFEVARARLLVSRAGFASAIWTRQGTDAWPSELALERVAPFRARVVDPSGHPVPGAAVLHGIDPLPRGPVRPQGLARDTFPWEETLMSGPSGEVELASFPGRNRLQASLSSACSAPWSGPARGTVELVLVATFSAAGRVIVPAGEPVPEGLLVRVLARQSEEYDELARFPVERSGAWIGTAIPLVPADGFVFLLEGAPFAQERRDVPVPAAGAKITIDFKPVRGIVLDVRVVSTEKVGLAGAYVSVNWNQEGRWQKLEQTAGSDGIARFAGCRPGRFWLRARASGHAPALLGPFEHLERTSQPIEVELERAGRIEGVCLDEGRPVRDFSVTFWQGSPNEKAQVRIEGSEDGRFTVEEAPLGEVALVAIATDGSRSEVVYVESMPNEAVQVTLVVVPSTEGVGRVVDATQGQPVEGARVQLHQTHEAYKVARCGPAVVTDAQGRFVLPGLVEGVNLIEVFRAGYALKVLQPSARSGESTDLGTIALAKQRTLRVRLRPDEPAQCSGLQAQLRTRARLVERSFDPSCELVFEGLDPEPCSLGIVEQNGTTSFISFEVLPDEDRLLEIPWPAGRMPVEIVPADGMELGAGWWLSASHLLESGEDMPEFHPVPSHGRVEIRRRAAKHVVLQLEDPEGVLVAVERFEIVQGSSTPLRFEVGVRARSLRIVDHAGAPIAGASIHLFLPDDSSGWAVTRSTDAQGLCLLGSFAPNEVVLGAYHPSHGVLPCRRVALENDGTSEVELDADLVLRARVVDRAVALPAVEVHASDGQRIEFGLGPASTDESGLAIWPEVGAGRYLLRVRHPGIWPYDASVELDEHTAPFVLDVRRVGDVSICVRTSSGAPAQGRAVDLHSKDQNAWASQWVEQGRVAASARPLSTDEQGELLLRGLPNGEYRCRVTTFSGEEVERVVDVVAGSLTKLEIVLP